MKSKKFKGKTLNTIESTLNGLDKCYFILFSVCLSIIFFLSSPA